MDERTFTLLHSRQIAADVWESVYEDDIPPVRLVAGTGANAGAGAGAQDAEHVGDGAPAAASASDTFPANTVTSAPRTICTSTFCTGPACASIINPGQFVDIALPGKFLRRPLSVCNFERDEARGVDTLTLVYKTFGEGTKILAAMPAGTQLNMLTGLGNGYSLYESGDKPLLLGGGCGTPPLYLLARHLRAQGKSVTAVLGFNSACDVFYEEAFRALGVDTLVYTADGTYGAKGFVTDALPGLDYTYFYTCGPEPMLRAVYNTTATSGQMSFESRMGCGFGACMGCSCKTVTGNIRICKEGPVLRKEQVLWNA